MIKKIKLLLSLLPTVAFESRGNTTELRNTVNCKASAAEETAAFGLVAISCILTENKRENNVYSPIDRILFSI